ncbi:MAG: L-2-hydroxyglutarate oxidase [Actinobacteria bacterium]|nr:L-2-hydroxyglutarate oxidase [Actinomycetota bacterium]
MRNDVTVIGGGIVGLATALHLLQQMPGRRLLIVEKDEPHCAGVAGLFVPQTGIVDYVAVAEAMARQIRNLGGEIRLGEAVTSISPRANEVRVSTTNGDHVANFVVTCGGLYSDRLTRETVKDLDLRILPFRGEYYTLRESARHLVQHLIYPVPDPSFPFLGVHFTRMIDGAVECGPNAVLAFAREGYTKTTVRPRELLETLLWPGFQQVARKYWKTGLGEYRRSFSKRAFVRALQRLVPAVCEDDLVPAPAGVRAQACDRTGNLLDDFALRETERVFNVCNAPSPAATASLAIGSYLATRVAQRFET